nr:hypothetical protein [Acetobacter malorum]
MSRDATHLLERGEYLLDGITGLTAPPGSLFSVKRYSSSVMEWPGVSYQSIG